MDTSLEWTSWLRILSLEFFTKQKTNILKSSHSDLEQKLTTEAKPIKPGFWRGGCIRFGSWASKLDMRTCPRSSAYTTIPYIISVWILCLPSTLAVTTFQCSQGGRMRTLKHKDVTYLDDLLIKGQQPVSMKPEIDSPFLLAKK